MESKSLIYNTMEEVQLKFDKMEIDTEAAKTFLKDEKHTLKEIEDSVRFGFEYSGMVKKWPNDYNEKLAKWKNLIQENMSLYVGLEALLRGRSRSVVETELRIVTNIIHVYTPLTISLAGDSVIVDTDSLIALGYAPINSLVVCNSATLAVCHLFLKHAAEAGFAGRLRYDESYKRDNLSSEVNRQCVGVVAEHSDIDSAVDAFINSTTKCLWQVRHIFVQESVYGRFKMALAWKCGSRGARADVSDRLTYEDKLYLLDPVHSDIGEQTQHVVHVEAYRTVKELLSLIANDPPTFLSLWSSDISEANEIALNTNSRITWINELSNFDIPFPLDAVFIEPYFVVFREHKKSKEDVFFKNRENWSKLNAYDRIAKMSEVLNKMEALEVEDDILKAIRDAVTIFKHSKDNEVEIQNGRLWLSLKDGQRTDTIAYSLIVYSDNLGLKGLFLSILCGNVIEVLIGLSACNLKEDLVEIMKNLELPIVEGPGTFKLAKATDERVIKVYKNTFITLNRYICTNYGTIFAN